MADIKYLITVDAAGAIKTMKEFDDTLDKTARSSGAAETAHKGLWKQIAIGELAYNAAVKAGRSMWAFLKDSAAAAMEAEKADKALASALEITGRPVAELSRHFGEMATKLQGATVYEDEAIKSTQALLLQLTNLDKDGIDRATKGAIGLASVMGMDLESAAQLVAKAMSGNEAALSRYGIQIDKTRSAEEQRVQIMEKLEQFYGRATAETETFGGQLAQLKNKYGDVKEAVGGWITSNHALMGSLNKIADALLFQLTLNDRLKEQTENQQEAENRWSDSLAKAAVAANMQYGAMAKLIEAYDGNTIAVGRAISQGKHGKELQEALVKVRREELVVFEKQQAALKAAEKGTNQYTAAENKAVKATKALVDILPEANSYLKKYKQDLDPIEQFLLMVAEAMGKVQLKLDAITPDFVKVRKVLHEISDEELGNISQMLAYTTGALDSIAAMYQAKYQQRQQLLDQSFQQQKWQIEQSTLSEQEKQIAISKLEEEHAKKSEALRISSAKKQKSISVLTAIMNVAEAFTMALKSVPWPLNLVAAALTVASGAMQIAAIKATPLAKGAIFKQPTLLGGTNGGTYQVAEAGEPEIVATPKNIRKAIGMDGSGAVTYYLQCPIHIGQGKIADIVVKLVQDAASTGRLKIAAKAVA